MSMQGITTNHLIHVDLLTKDYRVVGRVLVGNAGLSGLLGDPNKSFIEVRNAQLAYMNQPTRLVRRFNFVNVLKEQVIAACNDKREEIGPQAYAFRTTINLNHIPVHIAIHHYEITATIEWVGRYSLSTFLADSLGKYVPAYDVTIGSTIVAGFCIETKAALVNFGKIDLIADTFEGNKAEA